MVSSPSSSPPPSTITTIFITGIIFIIIILFVITTIISPSSSSPWALLSIKCCLSCDAQSRHKESFWLSFFANCHPFSHTECNTWKKLGHELLYPLIPLFSQRLLKITSVPRAGAGNRDPAVNKAEHSPCPHEAHRLKGEPTSKQWNPQINTLITGCCVI